MDLLLNHSVLKSVKFKFLTKYENSVPKQTLNINIHLMKCHKMLCIVFLSYHSINQFSLVLFNKFLVYILQRGFFNTEKVEGYVIISRLSISVLNTFFDNKDIFVRIRQVRVYFKILLSGLRMGKVIRISRAIRCQTSDAHNLPYTFFDHCIRFGCIFSLIRNIYFLLNKESRSFMSSRLFDYLNEQNTGS